MDTPDLVFVIPTYRLRDVGEAVEEYDQHFWRNGHTVRIVVFDDSSPANQQKYFPLLEQTRTHNELFYVGPAEKDRFLGYLNQRLRDPRLEGIELWPTLVEIAYFEQARRGLPQRRVSNQRFERAA